MELNQIRYFLEVAETQHVTRSAKRLHIAQPSLSLAIRRLEDEWGVPLFTAHGRNIILTAYGSYARRKLQPIMDELDSLPARLQAMASLENETIYLNVLAASTLITEAIIEYKKSHEKINFQLMQNAESQLYDIGVTTRQLYQRPENASENSFLCSENIYLAVPVTHRLAQQDAIDLHEAAEEEFISLMGSRELRWICDRYCRQAGFRPRIIFESDSPAAVKNMIAANIGVGFWPEFTWGRLETDHVRLLRIRDPLCQRDILFDCRPNKVNNSALLDFFSFLRQYCETARANAKISDSRPEEHNVG